MSAADAAAGVYAVTGNGTGAKLLALLGLAHRAGQLAVGASAVEKLVRRHRCPLVVVARDAGESQRRRWLRLRPVHGFVTDLVGRKELSASLGRPDVAVVAVSERGFIVGIERLGATVAPTAAAPAGSPRRPARPTRRGEPSGG